MNKWLYARSELYRKYADNLPHTLAQVEMLFSSPEVGWLPVKFNIDNKESEEIEFSYVYDPIPELIQWLEYILLKIGGQEEATLRLIAKGII